MRIVAISFLFILLGCGGKKELTESQKDSIPKRPDPMSKEVIVQMGFEEKTDAFTINAAHIEGTDLHLSVSYTGGCQDHVFELFTDGTIMKSLPPKQRFYLRHYSNQDVCESMVIEDLVFDLKGTTVRGNALIILIDGHKGELRVDF